MKWYETWDYKTKKPYWWTQRNNLGFCFEIRISENKFELYLGEHEKLLSKHETLQEAMDAIY